MVIKKACLYINILPSLALLPICVVSSQCYVIAIPTYSKFGLATIGNVFHGEEDCALRGPALKTHYKH